MAVKNYPVTIGSPTALCHAHIAVRFERLKVGDRIVKREARGWLEYADQWVTPLARRYAHREGVEVTLNLDSAASTALQRLRDHGHLVLEDPNKGIWRVVRRWRCVLEFS